MTLQENWKGSFPHCDSLVLHAPSLCKYCDMHPEWQQERIDLRINFTGQGNRELLRDPAEERRPLENIERWHGNVAADAQYFTDWDAYWKDMNQKLAELGFDCHG